MTRKPFIKKVLSKTTRAGLTFPVARVHRYLKLCSSLKNRRVSVGAAVYTAAVLEYLTAEVVELASAAAKTEKRKYMTPRHIMFSMVGDEEIRQLIKDVTIPFSGVMPHIQSALIKSTTMKKKATSPQPKATPVKMIKSKVKPLKIAKARGSPKPSVLPSTQTRVQADPRGITVLGEKILHLGQKLTVIKSDITNIAADAVVHPTNGSYFTGGLVGKALASKGGAKFNDEIAKLKATKSSLSTGEVASCAAIGIPAKQVIHVNSPNWSSANSVNLLEKSIHNILSLADQMGLKSLALPSVSSGNAGFPKQTAAETILRSINKFFATRMQSSIKQVYFVLYDLESVNVYNTELAKLV